MSLPLRRLGRLTRLLACGEIDVASFVRGLDSGRVTVTGRDGIARFCDSTTERIFAGCGDADILMQWSAGYAYDLSTGQSVRAGVGRDSQGLYHPALIVTEHTSERVSWGAPFYGFNEAQREAGGWMQDALALRAVPR